MVSVGVFSLRNFRYDTGDRSSVMFVSGNSDMFHPIMSGNSDMFQPIMLPLTIQIKCSLEVFTFD